MNSCDHTKLSCVNQRSSEPVLHIAIPTYNRPTYLKAQVQHLQTFCLNKNVPITVRVVVYDNCSSPEKAVDRSFLDSCGVEYVRRSENLGLMGNYRAIVERNEDPYLWILGDDDRLLDRSFPALWEALGRMITLNIPISLGHAYAYETSENDLCFTKENSIEAAEEWSYTIRNEMKISSLIAPSEYFFSASQRWDEMRGSRLNLAFPLFISTFSFISSKRFLRVNQHVFFCPTGNSSWTELADNLFVIDTPEVIQRLAQGGCPKGITTALFHNVFSLYRTKPLRVFLRNLRFGRLNFSALSAYFNREFYAINLQGFLKNLRSF